MSRRTLGTASLVIGLLLFLLSLSADLLGIGGHPDFGWKQITGAIVGGALAGWGFLTLRSR